MSPETRYLVLKLSGMVRSVESGDLTLHITFHMKQYPEGKEANKNNGLLLFLIILLQFKESTREEGKTAFVGLFRKMAKADIFIHTVLTT